MVIQTANKASSGSTCVLVRMVMEGDILFSGGRGCNAEPFFISFLLCSGSTVLLLSPPRTCYVLLGHKGGACRLSTEVEHLEDTTKEGLGESPSLPLNRLCLLSVVPSASVPPQRGPPQLEPPALQSRTKDNLDHDSRLLATLAASSIACPRLLEQSLPCNCHCLIVSQSAPAQSPFLPCMQISQERKDGSLLPGPHLLSCRADTQARCEDVGGPLSVSDALVCVWRKGMGRG